MGVRYPSGRVKIKGGIEDLARGREDYLASLTEQLRGGAGADFLREISERTPAEREQMVGRYARGYRESVPIASVNPEDYGDLLSELIQKKRSYANAITEINSPELQYTSDPKLLGRRRLLEEYAHSFEAGQSDPGTSEGGTRKLMGLASMQRSGRLSRLQKTEASQMEQLGTQKTGIDKAVDEQLDRLIVNAGIIAGEQRAQTGAQFAERGLGRSTFAGKAIEADTLGELQNKAAARTGAFQARLENKALYDATIKNIQFEKERTRAAIETESEADFVNRLNTIQTTDLQNIYAEINAKSQMAAKDKAFTAQLIGGLATGAGAIAGFTVGGPAGAIAGGTAAGTAATAIQGA